MDDDFNLIAHGGPGDSNGGPDPRRISVLDFDPKAETGLAIVTAGIKDRGPVRSYEFGNCRSRAFEKNFRVHCRLL